MMCVVTIIVTGSVVAIVLVRFAKTVYHFGFHLYYLFIY